jgi:tetratricopeptide (TPR) repeat protein
MLRQFPAALKTYDKVLELVPNDPDTLAGKARIYQAEGNLEQAGKLLAGINAQTPSFNAFLTKMNQLFLERHCDEAIRWIHTRLTESRDLSDIERLADQMFLALAQQCVGDITGARATAQQLLPAFDTLSKKDSDSAIFAVVLSQIYVENLASVEAMVGDKNRAIPRLQRLLEIPYSNCLTLALLRLDPKWDPLRSDPSFQKLCEEKKP